SGRRRRLFCALVDTCEIRLPIRWLSLAPGCHSKLRRRSSGLSTVSHPPTGRVAPRLRRRRRGSPGAWRYRSRLADLGRLLVTEVHIPLTWLDGPNSTDKGSDCENAYSDDSPGFHGSLLSFRESYRTNRIICSNRKGMLDGPFVGPGGVRGKRDAARDRAT